MRRKHAEEISDVQPRDGDDDPEDARAGVRSEQHGERDGDRREPDDRDRSKQDSEDQPSRQSDYRNDMHDLSLVPAAAGLPPWKNGISNQSAVTMDAETGRHPNDAASPTRAGARTPRPFAVVVIGRNEGQRLIDCLASLGSLAPQTIYVDSGSSDGSPDRAAFFNASIVHLDMREPFTAGRARNAGWRAALTSWPDIEYVQFVDGDCILDKQWLETAHRFMMERDDVAIVFGRRRERAPDQSVYNALCDREWSGTPGKATECGGDIFARVSALRETEGYASMLIAGEEPELCVRLRERGWTIWRLDAEMTLHDAAMTRLGQWWRRNTRAGHAFAEVSTLHWRSPRGIWRRSLWRALAWGGALPLLALAGAAVTPWALVLLLLYPLQVLRIARREGWGRADSWRNAFFDVLGKFAEFKGAATFFLNGLLGRRQRIIEYK